MQKEAKRVVMVGGGSTWTPGILKALIKYKDSFPLKSMKLFDIDENRQKTIGDFGKLLFTTDYAECDFSYTTDVKTAYSDVDFVFCQMRVGGYKMREQDEKVPLSMALIGQETCGAGGFAYGLRSIKDMIAMVQDVRKHSPNAWIINYTNPAAIVAVALKRAFPDDNKILNICDQPVNLLRSYGRLMNVDPSSFDPVYYGLNHFGWFKHLYDEQGNDYLPKILATIKEKGFIPADAEQRDKSWLDTYAMVEQIVKDFDGYLPNTYLQYYLYPEYKVSHLDPNYTRANEVMDGREKRVFGECSEAVAKNDPNHGKIVHNDAHGDMIVEVARSIAYNDLKTFIIITENNGLVENLDDCTMVEVAASVGSNGVRPYGVGKINRFHKALIENQYAFEELTVDAYFEQSYAKALQALTLNRTIGDAHKARKVLDALIVANKDYFPPLK